MTNRTDAANGTWTVQRLMQWTTEFFQRKELDEPRLACEVLLAHATGWKRIELYARFDQAISDDARTTFRELVQRAAEHEPIAYLVGKKEFFSLDFEVDKSVLIPRAETETLIEVACDQLKADELESPSLLDIGTGSGCIAITMLKQMSQATMIATDISADALAVAARNADKHDVSDRLTLMETDGMQGLPADQRFDAVLSNPPYISRDEHEQLDASVRDFEPRCALTDDADGLSFYEKIAGQAASWLSPQGFVAVEIGFGQTDPVTSIFLEHGPWAHKGTWKDRVEGHDRVLMFTTASP